jgi:diacylglycerol kinase (ATP)
VFVVLNPVSGSSDASEVRQALERSFPADRMVCEIHEVSPDERLADVVRGAIGRGCDLIVAAGGDGTVSAVANGLVGSPVPLGIIPLGTANVLARELGIPIALDPACELLAGAHATTRIDAMRVGDTCYFTQIGVGIDALMIRDTRREDKRRYGRVAYLWTAATRLVGFQPRQFTVTTDGHEKRTRASQVVVANCGILGQPPFRWGPDIRPDDGRLDVCIVRARSMLDYLKISWYVLTGQHKRSPNVRYLTARSRVTVASRHPLPVQGDGEIIGETPVAIEVVPDAVAVIVPG